MAKRHRTRSRTRRDIDAARRSAPAAPAVRETAAAPRVTHRPVRGSRTGYSRAAGAPSQALERAAALEGNFVVKDFRRLAVVVVVALALLILSGIVEGIVLK